MKILFIPAGSQATIFSFVPLAMAARNAGHEVFMTATEDLVPAVVSVGLPAYPVSSLPFNYFIGKDRAGQPVEIPREPAAQMRAIGAGFARMGAVTLDALIELAQDWRPDLIVGGPISYAAPLLAAYLDVPFLVQAYDINDMNSGSDPGALEELQPELNRLKLDRIPDPVAFLDVCPPSLRPEGAAPTEQMRWIPGNKQRRLERWMYTRGERRRVCVTLGNRVGLAHDIDFVRRLAEDVSALDVEVVIPVPESSEAELHEALGDEVRVGWIPLDVVAPTCSLIVHHGGGVTGMTAMNAGVPQLILPVVAYSTLSARRIAAFGAADVLLPGEATPENIVRSSRQLLSTPSYSDRSAQLSKEIAALPGPAELVAVLERVAAGTYRAPA
ncbi:MULTISPECIES: nucleotide disphospho-sugar-binding domain-containing protein [Amycolatopsis]|uniref:nucleotide disphospho-sugar-binding domain-containing protein n=1 Tax=Amycolatopsis TaxID=1813 RepID=UPI001C57AFCE|nr:nucleotide disphospho-sugar-binding domain-containing protein [Amycolatopsis sp. TNS106]